MHEDRRTPAVRKDRRTPAPQSSASPHQVQSRSVLSGPSGVPVPTGNLPGWQLTYSQDFSGTSLPPGWGTYSGEPGGDSYGYWDPADVSVSNGELHLSTTPNDDPQSSNTASTGGASFYGNPQTYGMYLVRMKGDYEPGLQISDIALLWPAMVIPGRRRWIFTKMKAAAAAASRQACIRGLTAMTAASFGTPLAIRLLNGIPMESSGLRPALPTRSTAGRGEWFKRVRCRLQVNGRASR